MGADGAAPEAATLKQLVDGYQISQAIHVAATLGVADLLVDGPRGVEELASATEAHADALYRLLRALAAAGVFHEDDERRFCLTPIGEGLRTDVPGSLAGWAAFVGRPSYWGAWGHLLHTVRTGENAFEALNGVDVWTYRSEHPEERAAFDAAMTSLTRRVDASVLEAYDFASFGTVVDVGGGTGALLAALLAASPSMQGVLFDQPHVVERAEELLRAAGVADRCRVVGGSFFDALPRDGDAYVLKSVLHDWEDEQAATILRACREAVGLAATLVVVERVVGPPNERLEPKLSDLNMLALPGGRERTLQEFEALLDRAGFRLESETPTSSGFSVIAASPVDGP